MKFRSLILLVLIVSALTLSACTDTVDLPVISDTEIDTEKITVKSTTEIPDETESEIEKNRPEEALFGIWEYKAPYDENIVSKTYYYNFNKVDSSYIGTYIVDIAYSNSERLGREFSVFEYRINNNSLELIMEDGTTQSAPFSLSDGKFSYQGKDYTKNDNYNTFKVTPDHEDYRNLFLSGMGADIICNGEYLNVYTMSSTLADNGDYLERGKPHKYSAIDIDNDGIKELFVQYSENSDTAIIRWKYGEWIADFISAQEVNEYNITWKNLPDMIALREGTADIEI